MPEDRVLVSIVSTFNSAGVNEAKAGLMGFTSANMAAVAGLALLFEAGKSAVQITEEHSKAESNLAGAIKDRGGYVTATNNSLKAFLQTNRDFISNQNDVINSYAALTREGVKAKDLSRLMTIALHIQAAEGGTLADAVIKVQQAEVGKNRGLTTAVGLQLEAIKATDTLAEKHAKVERNLKRVAAAYKTVSLTPLEIASNHLATAWETLAEKDGPALVKALADATDEVTKDLPIWEHWLTVLGGIVTQLAVALDPYNANKIGLAQGQAIRDTGAGPIDYTKPPSMSVTGQQHAGQPNYAGAAHARPYLPASNAAIVLTGPVTLVTPQANAAGVATLVRNHNRARL